MPVIGADLSKRILRRAGRFVGARAAVQGIRVLVNMSSLPEGVRHALMWPVTTALAGHDYTEDVRLGDGTVMRVGLDDIVNRRLLFFPQQATACWEPETSRLLLELLGDRSVVIVGGAHIGYHAILIAKQLKERGGEVHAFEPVAEFFERIEASRTLNGLSRLHGRRALLTDTTGTAGVHLSNMATSMNRPSGNGNGAAHETLPSFSVDDYVARERLASVTLMLLDIEGAELEALRGAEQLLTSAEAPDVIFEINREVLSGMNRREDDVYSHLRARGYSLFLIRDEYVVDTCAPPPARKGPIALVPIADGVTPSSALTWFNVYATRTPARLGGRHVVMVDGRQDAAASGL